MRKGIARSKRENYLYKSQRRRQTSREEQEKA